jgi:hypothetical protein
MDLEFLKPLYEHPGPWASAYVDTSRHSQDAPHRRRLVARAIARDLADQGADRATCEAVHDAIATPARSGEPQGRALFARDGEVVLDLSLTRAPGRDTGHWETLPRTTPLLDLAGEDPQCLVAYVGREGADFELRNALVSQEVGRVVGREWPVHRARSSDRSDWSEKHLRVQAEHTWERNAQEIADALTACQAETGADLLILVGDPRERRSVHERLPKPLRARAVESRHGMGSRLLAEEVEDIRAEHVRRRIAADVERFLDTRKPGGGGRAGGEVEGVPPVVEAAREHRVEELLVRPDGPDTHREVWIGEDRDQLAVRRSDLADLSGREVRPARADDALMRSAVAAGTPAVSVLPALEDGTPTTDVPSGGLGALTRPQP